MLQTPKRGQKKHTPHSKWCCQTCATVARFGDKSDAESGRRTDGPEKTPSVRRSDEITGDGKITCKKKQPDRGHASTESENNLFPVHADEPFAVPFRHAPTPDHNVCTLSRAADTHGVPSRRPSASEWATCCVLAKSSRQK